MSAFIFFLVFCQALGALSGAASAVWAEIAYLTAMRDGKIDHAERIHLQHIAKGLRFGMFLLLLSSFALVVVMYVLQAATQPALTDGYWMLVVLSLIVIYVAWMLSRKRISFSFGSAIIFTGWWFLVFLTFGELPALTFGAGVALYVVGVAMLYALFHYTRMLLIPQRGGIDKNS